MQDLLDKGQTQIQTQPNILEWFPLSFGFQTTHFTGSMKSALVTTDGSADGQQFGSFGNLKCVTLCRVKPSSAYGMDFKI